MSRLMSAEINFNDVVHWMFRNVFCHNVELFITGLLFYMLVLGRKYYKMQAYQIDRAEGRRRIFLVLLISI